MSIKNAFTANCNHSWGVGVGSGSVAGGLPLFCGRNKVTEITTKSDELFRSRVILSPGDREGWIVHIHHVSVWGLRSGLGGWVFTASSHIWERVQVGRRVNCQSWQMFDLRHGASDVQMSVVTSSGWFTTPGESSRSSSADSNVVFYNRIGRSVPNIFECHWRSCLPKNGNWFQMFWRDEVTSGELQWAKQQTLRDATTCPCSGGHPIRHVCGRCDWNYLFAQNGTAAQLDSPHSWRLHTGCNYISLLVLVFTHSSHGWWPYIPHLWPQMNKKPLWTE